MIAEAAKIGVIYRVKLYPARVTMNSQSGVLDIEQFNLLFAAIEEHDLSKVSSHLFEPFILTSNNSTENTRGNDELFPLDIC